MWSRMRRRTEVITRRANARQMTWLEVFPALSEVDINILEILIEGRCTRDIAQIGLSADLLRAGEVLVLLKGETSINSQCRTAHTSVDGLVGMVSLTVEAAVSRVLVLIAVDCLLC